MHVDVEVLEPMEFASICYSVSDGVLSQWLVDLLSHVDNVVCAGITERAPCGTAGDASEADVIRWLGTALRRDT